jgi:hypothetical protein
MSESKVIRRNSSGQSPGRKPSRSLSKPLSKDGASQLAKLSAEEVEAWLQKHGHAESAELFKRNAITGKMLEGLTDADLKDMGIAVMGERKNLLLLIENAVGPKDSGDRGSADADRGRLKKSDSTDYEGRRKPGQSPHRSPVRLKRWRKSSAAPSACAAPSPSVLLLIQQCGVQYAIPVVRILSGAVTDRAPLGIRLLAPTVSYILYLVVLSAIGYWLVTNETDAKRFFESVGETVLKFSGMTSSRYQSPPAGPFGVVVVSLGLSLVIFVWYIVLFANGQAGMHHYFFDLYVVDSKTSKPIGLLQVLVAACVPQLGFLCSLLRCIMLSGRADDRALDFESLPAFLRLHPLDRKISDSDRPDVRV